MSSGRTVQQKVGDWAGAYRDIRDAVTPEPLRQLITDMTSMKLGDDPTIELVSAYSTLVQGSIHLVRIVAANDRAAAIAAAMLTQSGVSRPIIEDGEDQ